MAAVGGKVRIHELAKELGLPSKGLLAHLKAEGEFVNSASSVVSAPVASRLRESFGKHRTDPPEVTNNSAGLTVARLASELRVPDKAVIGYLRHLGAEVRDGNSATTPQFADRVRKRFEYRSCRTSESQLVKRTQPRKVDGHACRPNAEPAPQLPEPAYDYLYESATDVVHHRDYLNECHDQALCGRQDITVRLSPIAVVADEVCHDCNVKLPEYQTNWWRSQFESVSAELAQLRADYRRLQVHSDRQRKQISRLHEKADQAKQTKKSKKSRSQSPKPAVPQRQSAGRTSAKLPKRAQRSIRVPVKREPPRKPDPEVVRKRVREMMAPPRPRTEAEKRSDEAARESMRSHKPSSWRLGRSPSSYG